MKTDKTPILKNSSNTISGEKALEILKIKISAAVGIYLNATGKKHGKITTHSPSYVNDITVDLDGGNFSAYDIAITIDLGNGDER